MAVAQLAERVFTQAQCSFVVSTGDNFYLWGVKSGSLEPWLRSYENVYARSLKRNWLAVLGNHDYGGSVLDQIRYRSPGSSPATNGHPNWGWRMDDRWWRLNLGDFGRPDIELFFVDTVTWEGKEGFPFNLLGDHVQFGDQDRQREWLAESLRTSAARIKLVIGHHPIYSVGPHGGKIAKRDFDAVLRAGGVSAYIHGHDHCLYYIRQGGFDYVCSGAGSQVLHKYTGGPESGCVLANRCPAPTAPDPELPEWLEYYEAGGVAVMTIGSDTIDMQFHTVDDRQSRRWPIAVRS
jgi:3',5'-cyclic AMP phosphodiesterase CpdA